MTSCLSDCGVCFVIASRLLLQIKGRKLTKNGYLFTFLGYFSSTLFMMCICPRVNAAVRELPNMPNLARWEVHKTLT